MKDKHPACDKHSAELSLLTLILEIIPLIKLKEKKEKGKKWESDNSGRKWGLNSWQCFVKSLGFEFIG